MIVCFQSAVPREDYTLDIIMNNGNRLFLDMSTQLETVQFCPLKDKTIWNSVEVQDTCLRWGGNSTVELSIDRLAGLFKMGVKFGEDAKIDRVTSEKNWLLHLELDNGNRLDMDMSQLLEFSLFAPLLQKGLWKTIKAKEHSLLWQDSNIQLEIPVSTILHYFA
ncbi:hypothetical protein CLNEO_03910 [Anaerotignum neopropionicum]|uniref:Uncharacterized protein n=1 Tax=Anaerotignum neopropionicum TaxID=36847 RepID=A0A136WI82_9FIRM|nr:DUF2442 domain-containing protein [Anaerotignum neopropionicum]KXL54164.1 hypothetical protein CLNEO_02620 [Anaerotignum neopropionicum]KXL54289.1 hypothetical protein CLNEO_03910 [Anaerotignum neopropionicum]